MRELAADGDVRFRLVVPQSKPSSGLVIYDEAVRESAQVRIDLAVSLLAEEGIEASGAVGDADPFLATMDAIGERRPSEVIVSTHPVTHSGWMRRDLIERVHNASGLPVEHIVTDLEHEGLPFRVTLVVANKTSSGEELRRAAQGEGRPRRAPPVHRGRAPARRPRLRAARGARAPCRRCSRSCAPRGCSARG